MADLREFHARFKKIENEIQSPRFCSSQVQPMSRALEELLGESQRLDERFIKVNQDFLYERALVEEADSRSKKLRKLCERLTRAGRKPGSNSPAHAEVKWRWPGKPTRSGKKTPSGRSPLVAAR